MDIHQKLVARPSFNFNVKNHTVEGRVGITMLIGVAYYSVHCDNDSVLAPDILRCSRIPVGVFRFDLYFVAFFESVVQNSHIAASKLFTGLP